MRSRPPRRHSTGGDAGRNRRGDGARSHESRRRHSAGGDGDRNRWGAFDADRGQSTTLDYTLGLAVATLVVTGLFFAAGEFVTDQRERVVRTELGVVGQQLADEFVAADRLVQAGDSTGALSLDATLPATVTGTGYTVSVDSAGSTRWINLTAADPSVTVSVQFETTTPIDPGSVGGGTVRIVYDPAAGHLEVRG